jgi:hypothetical protein
MLGDVPRSADARPVLGYRAAVILLRLSLAALLATLTACGSTGTLCGCTDDCGQTLTCPETTTPPGPTCPADPDDGAVTADCGIWASATLGDDGNPGSQAAPVRTLQRAVDLAPGGNVYACAETYFDPVVVPAGTSISGGWFCQGGWHRTDKRASLAPAHDVVPLRIVAGDGVSILSDLVIRAADASDPGGSSIAALADVGAAAALLIGGSPQALPRLDSSP